LFEAYDMSKNVHNLRLLVLAGGRNG
jgi:hypothetical protein